MASPSPLAQLIRSARLRLDLTQDQVALRARVPALKYQRLERGFYRSPWPELVNPVCHALDVPVTEALVAMGYDLDPSESNPAGGDAGDREC